MAQFVGYNDAVLFISLLYSCLDLQFEWDMFNTCAKPVHHWLLVSYACVLGFRLTHLLGSWSAQEGSPGVAGTTFILELRHKGALPRALSRFVWLMAVPFFAFWTLVGTSWLWTVRSDSPRCMPTDTHFWFSAFWLALCYIWISIYVALGVVAAVLEWRVRRAEGDLREIEDADVRSRWGEVSHLSGYDQLLGGPGQGLTAREILTLPCENAPDEGDAEAFENECSICISAFEPGDRVRRLPGCSHTFHKSCIDLWLLRNPECPLCKRPVLSKSPEGNSQ
jgi:hypothetical protein